MGIGEFLGSMGTSILFIILGLASIILIIAEIKKKERGIYALISLVLNIIMVVWALIKKIPISTILVVLAIEAVITLLYLLMPPLPTLKKKGNDKGNNK